MTAYGYARVSTDGPTLFLPESRPRRPASLVRFLDRGLLRPLLACPVERPESGMAGHGGRFAWCEGEVRADQGVSDEVGDDLFHDRIFQHGSGTPLHHIGP
jgi:hypothetical protein